MSDDEFEARLIKWLDMLGEGNPYPYYATTHTRRSPRMPGSMPCAPCTLRRMSCSGRRYPPSSPEESTRGYTHRRLDRIPRARQERPLQPDPYMRRVASSIRSSDDTSRLRLGLSAAAILQEREDYCDIIVSLAFLHHAARRAGIDPEPFFREVAGLGEASDRGVH